MAASLSRSVADPLATPPRSPEQRRELTARWCDLLRAIARVALQPHVVFSDEDLRTDAERKHVVDSTAEAVQLVRSSAAEDVLALWEVLVRRYCSAWVQHCISTIFLGAGPAVVLLIVRQGCGPTELLERAFLSVADCSTPAALCALSRFPRRLQIDLLLRHMVFNRSHGQLWDAVEELQQPGDAGWIAVHLDRHDDARMHENRAVSAVELLYGYGNFDEEDRAGWEHALTEHMADLEIYGDWLSAFRQACGA